MMDLPQVPLWSVTRTNVSEQEQKSRMDLAVDKMR